MSQGGEESMEDLGDEGQTILDKAATVDVTDTRIQTRFDRPSFSRMDCMQLILLQTSSGYCWAPRSRWGCPPMSDFGDDDNWDQDALIEEAQGYVDEDEAIAATPPSDVGA